MEQSITIIYVHGVGMSPSLWTMVSDRVGHERFVWTRPGYDGHRQVSNFGLQTNVLADLVNHYEPAVVVGVSGGATLALACAIRGPQGLAGVITHEPLVGALEPALDARVRSAGDRLAECPGRDSAVGFLCELYGERTWHALPGSARAWAGAHHDWVCREVSQFASFQPTMAGFARIRTPHRTTVGERSGRERHHVAEILESAGAELRVIPGAGHLAHVEEPGAFADAVTDFIATKVVVS